MTLKETIRAKPKPVQTVLMMHIALLAAEEQAVLGYKPMTAEDWERHAGAALDWFERILSGYRERFDAEISEVQLAEQLIEAARQRTVIMGKILRAGTN